jgi:hypothetical protein
MVLSVEIDRAGRGTFMAAPAGRLPTFRIGISPVVR